MLLVFIDESGHPHPNDAATRPVLVSICVDVADMKTINTDLFKIKRRILRKEQFEFEAKGSDLITPGHFRNSPERREFVESFFDCVSSWNICIFAEIMYRPQNVPPADIAFLPIQFRNQLIRINRHLEISSSEDVALVLLDGDGRQYNNIATRYSNWVYRSRMGQSLARIADTPYLVDSKITPGIQIADMAAYVIRTYQENKLFNGVPAGSHYHSAIARYYKILMSTSVDLVSPNGTKWHGFNVMPERWHYGYPRELSQE